jgi:hypothetical protein
MPGATTQLGAHTRLDLRHAEGLADVVIGAGIEPLDAVCLGVAGRQEDDRGGSVPMAQRAAEGQAVGIRQHAIDDVEVPAPHCGTAQPLQAIPLDFHDRARPCQLRREQLAYCRIVFDDQNVMVHGD